MKRTKQIRTPRRKQSGSGQSALLVTITAVVVVAAGLLLTGYGQGRKSIASDEPEVRVQPKSQPAPEQAKIPVAPAPPPAAEPAVKPVIEERDEWSALPGFRLDFEQYLPGQAVREWKHAWGEMGNDLLVASSDAASSGKRSLLFDRQDDQSRAMWGSAVRFPAFPESGGRMRFDFLYLGAGNDASFSFELRDGGSTRIVTFGIGNSRAGFNLHGKSRVSRKEKVRAFAAGAVRAGEWYRVTMEFLSVDAGKKALAMTNAGGKDPAADDDDALAVGQRAIRLRLGGIDGRPAQYDKVFPLPAELPAPQSLFLNCAPIKRNYLVHIDNFQAIPAPQAGAAK